MSSPAPAGDPGRELQAAREAARRQIEAELGPAPPRPVRPGTVPYPGRWEPGPLGIAWAAGKDGQATFDFEHREAIATAQRLAGRIGAAGAARTLPGQLSRLTDPGGVRIAHRDRHVAVVRAWLPRDFELGAGAVLIAAGAPMLGCAAFLSRDIARQAAAQLQQRLGTGRLPWQVYDLVDTESFNPFANSRRPLADRPGHSP